jgi:BolA protein
MKNLLWPGAYDDPNGSHISIAVVSSMFEGKRPVQRQQLVYRAIWEELQGPVHAVDSMVCRTPAEAAAATQ